MLSPCRWRDSGTLAWGSEYLVAHSIALPPMKTAPNAIASGACPLRTNTMPIRTTSTTVTSALPRNVITESSVSRVAEAYCCSHRVIARSAVARDGENTAAVQAPKATSAATNAACPFGWVGTRPLLHLSSRVFELRPARGELFRASRENSPPTPAPGDCPASSMCRADARGENHRPKTLRAFQPRPC